MWQLAAVGAVVVVAGVLLVLVFAKGEKREAKSGAVAKDDLGEAQAQAQADQVYHDVTSLPAPTGDALDQLELARLERAEARAGVAKADDA